MSSDLQGAVQRLPELYQPLYGHEPEGADARRACTDRLACISDTLEAFRETRVRLLDVGSAQGYFTLGLAERFPGFDCIGLDNLAENIDVARQLALERKPAPEFQVAEVRAGTLRPWLGDGANAVLLLNVLHHVCTRFGWDETDRLLAEVAQSADVVFIELASAAERLEWTAELPSDDAAWLRHFGFTRPIGEFDTHIPGVRRRLYVCSSRWVLCGKVAFRFTTALDKSHGGALGSREVGRRYFMSDEIVAKHFSFIGPAARSNWLELRREARLLASPPVAMAAPRFLGSHFDACGGVVVRSRWDGSLLSEFIKRPLANDEWARTMQALVAELEQIESAGLFHHDLRPWNVLVVPGDRLHLIDFGSMTRRRTRTVFEDLVEFGYWLVAPLADPALWGSYRSEVDATEAPYTLRFLAREVDATALSDLSFARLRHALERAGRTHGPAAPASPAPLHDESQSGLLRRLARALKGNRRLAAAQGEAQRYAASLAESLTRSELHSRLRIEAQTAELAQTRSDASRQVTALTKRAERAEAHGRALAASLRRAKEDLAQAHDDARRQVAAFAQRAATAEHYAASLAADRDRLQADAAAQIDALGQRANAAETYAASLANELEKTQRELGATAAELDAIKRSKPYRALNLFRRMMRGSPR